MRGFMLFLGALFLGIPWSILVMLLWQERATKRRRIN
jgi:hypothetical protein